MFEAAELGRRLSKEAYRARAPKVRAALLAAQQRLRTAAPFPVIVVFAGVDGAGKSETVNLLNAWMDPRWIVTRAFGEPSDEERERPEAWRFWRELPPRGRVALYLSAWYSRPVLDRAYRRLSRVEFEHQLGRLAQFERTLADDGAVILKFWMHLGRRAQRKQLERLESDPLTRWRVTARNWQHWKMYDRFIDAAEQTIRATSTANAPWMIVEGRDEEYRTLTVAQALLEAMTQRVEARAPRRTATRAALKAPGTRGAAGKRTVLSALDMSARLHTRTFERELLRQQGDLNRLQRRAVRAGVSTVLVFEGADAAGKGGAIRRVTAALDARECQVIAIAAPTDEERAHHYLWRFWRHLPRAGRVTIFDRSWYGRVLVERVEALTPPADWRRAYTEINEFEDQLLAHGIVLVKFWIHVTKDEQLKRFRTREASPVKRWKITPEDWRNRARWDAYEQAVNEMVERTSTHDAPWTLIPGNDKDYARVAVLRTACARLRKAL